MGEGHLVVLMELLNAGTNTPTSKPKGAGMNSELKPCPLCGDKVYLRSTVPFEIVLQCNSNFYGCPYFLRETVDSAALFETMKEAIKLRHNTRPVEDALNQRITSLEQRNAKLEADLAESKRVFGVMRSSTYRLGKVASAAKKLSDKLQDPVKDTKDAQKQDNRQVQELLESMRFFLIKLRDDDYE